MTRDGENIPFGALLSATSLVVSVLFVAGFSYRWSYYYNFGLKDLLFNFSFQSLVVSSIELLRQPSNAAITTAIVVGVLVVTNFIIWGVERAARAHSAKRWVNVAARVGGLNSRLVADTLRALTLIYAALVAGQIAGYRTFQAHIIDGPQNPLPAVTLAWRNENDAIAGAALCDREPYAAPAFVGSALTLRRLDENTVGCDVKERTWRLLYRDDNHVYLFAAVAAAGDGPPGRPLTLAVPNRDDLLVITE